MKPDSSRVNQLLPGQLCFVAQLCPTLGDPMEGSPPGSSVHGDSPGKSTRVGCHALLQGNLPNPGIKSRSPALQVDSSLSEPLEEPNNTGVGILSLLQGIFPIHVDSYANIINKK